MKHSIESLEKRVANIEKRNAEKESDKSWGVSKTRRFVLAILTYFTIGMYMWAIGVNNPWVNAIIPTVGFILSTLSLPLFRSLWEKEWYKKS